MPNIKYEKQSGYPFRHIMGVDEVGRGCLAGPVVAGAVILPVFHNRGPKWLSEVDDSKKLLPEVRRELDAEIRSWVYGFGIGSATVEEIDEINIYHASHLAMKRAMKACEDQIREKGLAIDPLQMVALIDGNAVPKGLTCKTVSIIQGDAKSISIACASIVAKVWRDQCMTDLCSKVPGYLFSQHKGYATPDHQKALMSLGYTVHHRKSFEPIKSMVLKNRELTATPTPSL